MPYMLGRGSEFGTGLLVKLSQRNLVKACVWPWGENEEFGFGRA